MSNHDLLINKFINRTISSEERKVLEKWVLESDSNMDILKVRLKESGRETLQHFDSDFAYQKFSENLKSRNKTPNLFQTAFKYAAVLAILLTIGILVKQQLNKVPTAETMIVNANKKIPAGNDIIIKLGDGSTQVLNSDGNEVLTDNEGNVIANQGGNSLVFDEGDETMNDIQEVLNEIYIPFGQTFKLKLSDGTLVWLNAGSKLRFPQNFSESAKNRTVYLDGEAFFEVTKNERMPFIVNTQELDIKVLGTKFNVSSYESENTIATTLVEGSVSVYETRTPKNELKLSPSYQAKYSKFENSLSKAKVDTSIYTAWMQNKLVIDNLKFSEVLAKLERRHHVRFVNKVENLNDQTYKGEFNNEDIESILETISLSTPFKYEINQNVITITK